MKYAPGAFENNLIWHIENIDELDLFSKYLNLNFIDIYKII